MELNDMSLISSSDLTNWRKHLKYENASSLTVFVRII